MTEKEWYQDSVPQHQDRLWDDAKIADRSLKEVALVDIALSLQQIAATLNAIYEEMEEEG